MLIKLPDAVRLQISWSTFPYLDVNAQYDNKTNELNMDINVTTTLFHF